MARALPPTSSGAPQVRPATEGWQQKKDAEGRPLLQFASPKRGKPPVHLADLTPEQRVEKAKELGLPGFRAGQLHNRFVTSPTVFSEVEHTTGYLQCAMHCERVG